MNKKLAAVFAGILVITIIAGYNRLSAFAQPGGAADPLVTKTYVDEQINILRTLISQGSGFPQTQPIVTDTINQSDRDALFMEIIAYIDSVYGNFNAPSSVSGQAQVPYEAVFVSSGKTVIALSGTEMILRSGKAVVVSGENGLCNVTIGADVQNGSEVKINNLHIVPRSDGRGMRFTEDSYIMIKGEFYIVD